MATKITDFAATARLWQNLGPTSTEETAIETDAVDMLDADGPCFAILSVVPEAETSNVDGILQSSDDGTTWEDIPNAIFPTISDGGVEAITFQRPARYVRAVLVLENGGDPLAVSLLLGESRKLI